jgi:competence protein ComGC
MSGVVIFLVIVAVALLLIIIVPILIRNSDTVLDTTDQKLVETAEYQANIEYQQSPHAFAAVYDGERKKFVDQKAARTTVTPYGTSKDHQGKYILVTVDKDGNISSEWILP